MEGCLSNLVKYLLFITNFLVFILACVVLGLGIWVKVDSPTFLHLFDEAESVIGDSNIDIGIYTSAALILIIVSAIIVVVTFFGCCGALKENKCMLGTYFTLILALFVVLIVGAVIGYTGDLKSSIKDPLLKSMDSYNDRPADDEDKLKAFKKVWNEVQDEFRCCGVNNVTDWGRAANPNWEEGNKPEGCCRHNRNGDELDEGKMRSCRAAPALPGSKDYNFEGCFTKCEKEINNNQELVVGVAIGVVVVMFLNMLFAFAMCTMAH